MGYGDSDGALMNLPTLSNKGKEQLKEILSSVVKSQEPLKFLEAKLQDKDGHLKETEAPYSTLCLAD